jgi:hypothetical protein
MSARIADTGLIVAALDRSDAFHGWALAELDRFKPFQVCEAVLTEAGALLSHQLAAPVELVRRGWLETGFSLGPHLDRVAALMAKYADRPMDFADACVVVMAEEARRSTVWTVDRADFSVYRLRRGEPVPCRFPPLR